MRLIDGDNVKENLQQILIDELGDTDYDDGLRQGIELAICVIDEHLTVEPIIRCKDCKYASIDVYDNSNVMPIWCEYCDNYRNETDFCSRGEKKDE